MINLKKNMWLAVTLGLISFACTQGSQTSNDPQANGKEIDLSPSAGTNAVLKSLTTCPADSYKFINYQTLADEKALSGGVAQDNLCAKPKETVEELIAVEANGNNLLITRKDGEAVTCGFSSPITDFAISSGLTRDLVAVSTQSSLAFAYINSLNIAEKEKVCEKFNNIQGLGGVISIAVANSKDNTISVEKTAGAPPADIQLSTSINLLPTGYKFSDDMKEIFSDYVYLLSPENKVFRIKPAAFSGGCAELVWAGAEGSESAAVIMIEAGELKIYGVNGGLLTSIGI